jgi:YidC/Oxa1 family membrane protein insertase
MFETLIARPIFNLLVLIYAIIPGHNFGLAIIVFTIIIRLLLWPLVKKQLHQTKLMRQIQPELKRIAKETKGDRQKQYLMQMELYKERGISPFRPLGIALIQFPILIALYLGLQRVVKDPHQLVEFAYPGLQHLPWLEKLSHDPKLFDSSLFGIVDLHRSAIGNGGLYIPALIIVVASVLVQYYQAKQLLPQDKDGRSLRAILKEAGKGQQADQTEVNAAVGRMTIFFLPAIIFVGTIGIASALSLYWFVGGLVALIQQSIVLREDKEEMEELSAPDAKDIDAIPEAEVVETSEIKPAKKKAAKKGKKRRKK